MPWNETHTMDLKVQMITDWLTNNYCPTELARIYGVSRKTVYKWISRYEQDREYGLADRSRAPLTRPSKVCDSVKQMIAQTKLSFRA